MFYFAFGDSMSIDTYPELDAAELALRRSPKRGLGASSLLYRNDAVAWPEFERSDLVSRGFDLYENFAADGATAPDLERQLALVSRTDAAGVVTVTIGGNDLLGIVFSAGDPDAPATAKAFGSLRDRIRRTLSELRRRLPAAHVIATNVYDPTDRSWLLPAAGGTTDLSPWGRWFQWLNAGIADAARDEGCSLADLDAHFRGHGWRTGDRWYWPASVIEPSARGASEIRRVWWTLIQREMPEK